MSADAAGVGLDDRQSVLVVQTCFSCGECDAGYPNMMTRKKKVSAYWDNPYELNPNDFNERFWAQYGTKTQVLTILYMR